MIKKSIFIRVFIAIFFIGLVSCEEKVVVPSPDEKEDTLALLNVEKDIEGSLPIDGDFIEGKFTPPDGKILLFVGQDSETLSDYVKSVPEDHIEGITLYSRIASKEIGNEWGVSLPGFWGPADWGGGINDLSASLAESPEASLALGLFISDAFHSETPCSSTHTKAIAAGEYDEVIEKMLDYFKALAPRKVFLRIGYEFDGLWNCYKPEPYKAAFRYIYKKMVEQKADNVVSVWQSAVWPAFEENNDAHFIYDLRRDDYFESWYPGDDVVDWVSLSVFYRDLSQWNFVPAYTPAGAQEKLLKFARERKKPVFISEAAPQGYSIGELTHSFTQLNNPMPITAEQLWNGWFASYFGFIYKNRDVVRAASYINAKWESQAMWRCERSSVPNREKCQTGNWGDSRVQANPYIKKKWLEIVNDETYWIQTSLY